MRAVAPLSTEQKKKRGRPVKQIDRRVKSYRSILTALPSEIGDKLRFNRDVYTKSYALTKWLMAYGLTVLSTHEFVLMHFISSRTVHFGKLAEMITKEHFMKGVWSDDDLVCSPVGMWERELYKTIHSLEDKGFILVQPLRIGSRKLPTLYEIAIDFITNSKPSEAVMNKLRMPRAVKTAEIIDLDAVRQAKSIKLIGVTRHHSTSVSLVSHDTMKYTKVNKEDNEVVASPPASNETPKLRERRKPKSAPTPTAESELDCKEHIRHVIQVAATRSSSRRQQTVATAARGSDVTLSQLNASWKQAMIAAYGACPVVGLTTKEYAIFKRIVKAHELPCTWIIFFTWVIGNWQQINKENLELSEYHKRRSGDWSIKDSNAIFLGTKSPDMFMMVKNFVKLLKRFSQKDMEGRAAGREDSKEVRDLKEQLEVATRRALVNSQLLKKALSTHHDAPPAAKQKAGRVSTIDPEGDKFFQEQEDSLPEWK